MAIPRPTIYKSPNKFSPGFIYNRPYHKDVSIIETKEKISCDHAQEDGWHDHADLFSGGKIKLLEQLIAGQAQYVACPGPRPHMSEPLYLSSKLTNDGHESFCKPTPQREEHRTSTRPSDRIWIMEDPTIRTHYSPLVSDKYKVGHIILNDTDGARTAAGLDMRDTKISLIQECLVQMGINETIYILRDVAYANWRDDIGKWTIKEGKETQVITLITGTCVYDPGPTLTCYTGSAIEQGFANPTSRSRYAIFYPSPEETILEFPAFPAPAQPIISPEQLIYSKFPSTLHSTIDKTILDTLTSSAPRLDFNRAHEALQKTQATLYIQEDLGQGKRSAFIVNKNNSSITKKISELPLKEVLNYIGCMGKKLPLGAPFDEGFFTSIISAGGVKKVLSKKFGDSGIALSTLHSSIPYILFEPTENAGSSGGGYFTLSRGNSNDIHAFLSYDAVAVAAAIEYGCPIVIHNTHKGFVIYVSRFLQETFSTPYAIAFSKHQGIGSSISSLENSKTKFDAIRPTLTENLQQIRNMGSFIETVLRNISVSVIDNDYSYHLFLSIFYLFSPIIQLLTSLKIIPDTNISEEVLRSIETTIGSIKTVYQSDETNFINATIQQKSEPTEGPFIQSLQQTQNVVAIEEGIQRVKEICDPFLLFKQQFDTIENVFLSILTKIDIKFGLSSIAGVGLVALYFSGNNVEFLKQLTNISNNSKMTDIVCAPAGAPLIKDAYPFRDTQNSSCFRKFFRTSGIGQKLPYFDIPTIKCIVGRINENNVILQLFREKLSSIFVEVNSKCDGAMSRLLSQSFSQINDELIGTPLERIVIPALLVGGAKKRRKTLKKDKRKIYKKSIRMNKTYNTNNYKIFGGAGLNDYQLVLHSRYMYSIGQSFIILYMTYIYEALLTYLNGLKDRYRNLQGQIVNVADPVVIERIDRTVQYLKHCFSILFDGVDQELTDDRLREIQKIHRIILNPTIEELVRVQTEQILAVFQKNSSELQSDHDENGYRFYLEYALGSYTTEWGRTNFDLFIDINEEIKKISEEINTLLYDTIPLSLYRPTHVQFNNYRNIEDAIIFKEQMDDFYFFSRTGFLHGIVKNTLTKFKKSSRFNQFISIYEDKDPDTFYEKLDETFFEDIKNSYKEMYTKMYKKKYTNTSIDEIIDKIHTRYNPLILVFDRRVDKEEQDDLAENSKMDVDENSKMDVGQRKLFSGGSITRTIKKKPSALRRKTYLHRRHTPLKI